MWFWYGLVSSPFFLVIINKAIFLLLSLLLLNIRQHIEKRKKPNRLILPTLSLVCFGIVQMLIVMNLLGFQGVTLLRLVCFFFLSKALCLYFRTGSCEQNELCPGSIADSLVDKYCFPYEEIPHFPVSTVKGHTGQMVFGYLEGVPVMCMQGRFHYYEGYPLWKVN